MADEITLDEASALMDKYAAEAEAQAQAEKKIKKKEKVKDLLKEGAKQGLSGLGLGTSKQLKALDEEYAPTDQGAPNTRQGGATR